MKIVDVNPFFYPFKGGIEHRMHDTSRLLAERGHDVTILTGQLPDTAPEERTEHGYRILRLKSTLINLYNPPIIRSKDVLGTLKGLDADIVNYNYRWAPSYNGDLRRYDGKKVFTYHNMWGEGMGAMGKVSEVNDSRFKACLDTFDHIIAVSDYVRDDLIRRGYSQDHVTSVPSCLSRPPSRSCTEGDYILSLGRLVKTKGLEHLICAMADVDCKLILCGKGPEQDRLKRLIGKKGLSEKIEMRGWISDEEKEALMDGCKLFVMPSLFESLGLAAIEVMSYGKPLVCTNVNGLPETVQEGGIAVPPKDQKAISDAVNRLLYDDGLRARLGDNAFKRAQYYNWDDMMPKIEGIYQKVID